MHHGYPTSTVEFNENLAASASHNGVETRIVQAMKLRTGWMVAGLLAHASLVLAEAWVDVRDAARFERSGATRVRMQVRQEGGGACGGGGCTQGITIRNVRGALPSQNLSYYYSDRPGANPGCHGTNFAALFSQWREVEIAPIAGGAEHRPSCGFGVMVGTQMQYWVMVRIRE